MLLKERPVLESESELAQSNIVSAVDEALHVALEDVDAQRVKRHRVLEPLRLVHLLQGCRARPINILARLLVFHEVL